jgi:hypothetical protein
MCHRYHLHGKRSTGTLAVYPTAYSHTQHFRGEYTVASRAARDITWLIALATEMHVPIHNTVPKLSVDYKPHSRHDGGPLPPGTPVIVLDIDNSGSIAMAIADGPTKRTKHTEIQQLPSTACRKRPPMPTISLHHRKKADFITKMLQRAGFHRACMLLLLAPRETSVAMEHRIWYVSREPLVMEHRIMSAFATLHCRTSDASVVERVLGRPGDIAGLTSVGNKFFFIGLPTSC